MVKILQVVVTFIPHQNVIWLTSNAKSFPKTKLKNIEMKHKGSRVTDNPIIQVNRIGRNNYHQSTEWLLLLSSVKFHRTRISKDIPFALKIKWTFQVLQ